MSFENFVFGETLAIAAGASSIQVTTEAPYRPPHNLLGSYGRLIISDFARSPTRFEIVTYTGFSATGGVTTLTGVQRGQEGTDDQEWPAGSVFRQDVTAADLRMLELQELRPYIVAGSIDTTLRKLWIDGEEAWVNSDAPDDVMCVSIGYDEAVAFGGKGGFVGLCSRTGSGIWLSVIHPDDVTRIRVDVDRNIISGSAPTGVAGYTIKKTSPTGNNIWTYSNTTNSVEGRSPFFDVDRDGCIFVTEADGLRKISPDGASLMRLNLAGGGNGAWVGGDGKFYAVINSLLRRYNRSLKQEYQYDDSPFVASGRLFVDKGGYIYMICEMMITSGADIETRIMKVDPGGVVVWSVPTIGFLYDRSEVSVYGDYVFVSGVDFEETVQVRDATTGALIGVIGQQFLSTVLCLDSWRLSDGSFIRAGGAKASLDLVRQSDIAGDVSERFLLIEDGIEPSTPPAGHAWLYVKAGSLKVKFSNGTVVILGSSS